MKQAHKAALQKRLEGLSAFLPQFEQAGFRFGEWLAPKATEPGVVMLPYYALSQTATAFIQAAYKLGWIDGGFDWPRWTGTEEAIRLRDDERAIRQATKDQLSRLLTVLIRQDRFNEGSLGAAFESGLLVRICRRAAELDLMAGA